MLTTPSAAECRDLAVRARELADNFCICVASAEEDLASETLLECADLLDRVVASGKVEDP